MKRKLLSAAVSALALGGFAQSAQATSYDLYLAGSSAQDNLIMTEVANLCVSGTLTYYVDDNYGSSTASTWGNNYKAYACTINSAAVTGVSSGDFVTFHKVNLGGSATGVAPLFAGGATGLLTAGAVPTLNINNSNCYQLTTGYTSKVGNTTPGVQLMPAVPPLAMIWLHTIWMPVFPTLTQPCSKVLTKRLLTTKPVALLKHTIT